MGPFFPRATGVGSRLSLGPESPLRGPSVSDWTDVVGPWLYVGGSQWVLVRWV